MNLEKTCSKCGYEIEQDRVTMYEGKKFCECDKKLIEGK